MIRYVHIGEQITDGAEYFAFWDASLNEWLRIGGRVVFGSLAELDEASVTLDDVARQRLRTLIPEHAWNREIKRRLVELDRGTVKLLPVSSIWDEKQE